MTGVQRAAYLAAALRALNCVYPCRS